MHPNTSGAFRTCTLLKLPTDGKLSVSKLFVIFKVVKSALPVNGRFFSKEDISYFFTKIFSKCLTSVPIFSYLWF